MSDRGARGSRAPSERPGSGATAGRDGHARPPARGAANGSTSIAVPERPLPLRAPGGDGVHGGRPPARPRVGYLAERLGLGDDAREFLHHPVPMRTSPLDYLGFLTAFVFASQIVTGMLLATAYSPTVTQAYPSVRAIMASPSGALLRGLHAWGADALIILAVLHLLRVFFIGAYKAPREFTWVTGTLLLSVTIGFAFTGYLLPWDQQAYWATVVGTAMAAYAPVVGGGILHLLRGGTDITGATLTRFYALHVLVLPGLLLLIFAAHFALVLTHGQTEVETRLPKGYRAAHRKGDTADFPHGPYRPFWPYTPAQMTVAVAVVVAILGALAIFVRVPLLAAADPLNRAHYRPVPAWYFYGVYQFLKFLPGRLDGLGMVGLPLLAAVVLIGLPFADRGPARAARRRPFAIGAATLVVIAAVGLTYMGWRGSRGVSGTATVVKNPTFAADIAPIFSANCTTCHGAAAPSGGLSLTSYAGVMKGGRSGAVIKPGDPAGSLLVQALEGRAPNGVPPMPLGQQPLPATDIQTVKNWIQGGAKP